MVGQTHNKEKVDKMLLSGFPHSLMITGAKGSGKHTLCNYIAEKLNIDVLDITDSISFNNILSILISPIPTLYVIEINSSSIQLQNEVLKLVEEPGELVYIAVLTENEQHVIETLKNRCVSMYIEPYSTDELNEVCEVTDKTLIQYCSVPGDIMEIMNSSIDEILKLCDTVVTMIGKANYANLFVLSSKMKTTKTSDGINLNVFLKILSERFYQRYCDLSDSRMFRAFVETNSLIGLIKTGLYNQSVLFDNFLIRLRRICS